ncbi:hypothetical protein Pcinc_044506 [Petrolisthes cinctipes]|uniref:peptide-methionine (S)-S-oxide reductase n=1 Tax=Petrolisthes cinctipes TaxID=88211 RepID=A0AAE1ETU4_PETCI|nr:hypothetical protein Pcinc_044506 [Petrolisthes cinctipes]
MNIIRQVHYFFTPKMKLGLRTADLLEPAQFGAAPGIIRTRVGFAGGSKVNPTYRSMGDHTETIDVDYDPEQTDYESLLSLFWKYHDPTSKCSRQYMSAIFYHDEEQKSLAEKTLKYQQSLRARPVTTSILPFTKFYEAEDYHQKYLLQRHPQLVTALDVDPGEDLIKSHVAARINGYVGGYGSVANFDKEQKTWGITEKMAEYIREEVILAYPGLR